MNQIKDIKYVNKNFSDLKSDLIEYAKNYYPDTYNDFSPASPGLMFIEMAAYVGDVLSFYQDTQIQETYLQYAKNPANLYTLAYMMGYRPKTTTVAEVELELTQTVDANASADYKPDWSQALFISENSTVRASSGNNTTFLLRSSVDFGTSSSYQPVPEVVSFDGSGNPQEYLLKRNVKAFSGEIKTISETVGSAEKFYTITIEDDNIIGILDIVDSSSTEWYEVPFLGQETLLEETQNTNGDRGEVSRALFLEEIPRRFTTRFTSTNQLKIQFGAGTLSTSEEETFIPNPENVGSKTANGVSRLDYTYNPANFLYTDSYGLAPSNTTLTIRYLKGGGISANEASNTITQQVNIDTVGSTDKLSTLTVTNLKPATGGRDGDSVEELRENSLRAFGEQSRIVTLSDYVVRSLSLPARLGSVDKVFPIREPLVDSTSLGNLNSSSTSLYVLSKNSQGNLQTASNTLRDNLKKYLSQFIMLTDSINIRDAFIVNIGIDYEIIPLPGFSGREVLVQVSNELIDYFDINKWNINQPINLSKITTLIDRVKGVQSVQSLKIQNKVGGRYSEFEYDIDSATRKNIIYPSLDPCIFEVKFPDDDIKGRVIGQ